MSHNPEDYTSWEDMDDTKPEPEELIKKTTMNQTIDWEAMEMSLRAPFDDPEEITLEDLNFEVDCDEYFEQDR